MTNKRNRFWDQPPVTPSVTAQMRAFIDAAVACSFQTRYIGEERWWPVSGEEVARTLGVYEANLDAALERLLSGEVLRSPVAEFRIEAMRSVVDTPRVVAV